MIEKADDTYGAVSFIEIDGGSGVTTMGATHPKKLTRTAPQTDGGSLSDGRP